MLRTKIQDDIKESLRGKKEIVTSVLRLLLAAISTKETEKRTKIWKAKSDTPSVELEKLSQLTDEEIIETVSSEIKKRREAIGLYEKGGRQELAEKETKELEILQKYLPEQLSEEEVRRLVKEAVEKTGAKEIKDMGKVMAELMPSVKGRADGSLVSKIVKEALN